MAIRWSHGRATRIRNWVSHPRCLCCIAKISDHNPSSATHIECEREWRLDRFLLSREPDGAVRSLTSFMQGDHAMNQEHRFELAGPSLPSASQSPLELEHFAARARQQRANAAAAMIASASRSVTEALRSLLTLAVRWQQQRATRDALMRCSDRVLADIGIEREHIPLVAKGVDPAEYELMDSAFRRWWTAARARLAAAWRGKARATADLPRARRLHRPRARRDRSAARRHPCHRARAPGPASGGLITGGGRQTRWRPPPTRSPGAFTCPGSVWPWLQAISGRGA